ncbi:hypothetical protein QBC41DRAFT_300562 [Cercophora samala]|uniref:Methyltransferase domain-containing protein n=1 Tax=Cercophora samala TaxID=330535 RepID=A0AA39ZHY3_9PEZI|nr:hypothetical protein QBC41DRAFT_300562 [Cercophora samala]
MPRLSTVAFRVRNQNPYLSWYMHSTQTKHVYDILHYLPEHPTRILEIGCGMGTTTDVLAYEVKPRAGHVDALDPAPQTYVCPLEHYVQSREKFYPLPYNLGDHQHCVSTRNPTSVTFHNTDAIQFLDDDANKDKKWDLAVLWHSVFYFESLDVLKATLVKLKGKVKRVLIVEYALRPTLKYAMAHLFATMLRGAVGEMRQKKGLDTQGHLTCMVTPDKIKKTLNAAGWKLEKEADVIPDEELIDGDCETTWALGDAFQKELDELGEGGTSSKKEEALRALKNATLAELVADDRRKISR